MFLRYSTSKKSNISKITLLKSPSVSETVRDRPMVENHKISHPPLYLAPDAEGVPIEIGYRRWGDQKTRMMGLLGRKRSLTIHSAVWIECINVTDRQTDGQTDGHRATAKTARLRIASRGKTKSSNSSSYAVVTTTLRFQFDFNSTAVRLLMKGH